MKTFEDFKGTKGEFTSEHIRQDDLFELIGDNGIMVCRVPYWAKEISMQEAQANAKLFAGSKKLLEALILAHKQLEGAWSLTEWASPHLEEQANKILAKLEQAINEAL